MILDKVPILQVLSPSRRAARKLADRWMRAATREPELAADVIRMGGILAQRPRRFENGVELPEPVDPIRLAIDQGRREFATELLALMKISPFQLSQLTENDDET